MIASLARRISFSYLILMYKHLETLPPYKFVLVNYTGGRADPLYMYQGPVARRH